jgi:hypothetical protein
MHSTRLVDGYMPAKFHIDRSTDDGAAVEKPLCGGVGVRVAAKRFFGRSFRTERPIAMRFGAFDATRRPLSVRKISRRSIDGRRSYGRKTVWRQPAAPPRYFDGFSAVASER